MMNSLGGVVLVGVADDGSVVGIEEEYEVANPSKPSWDGYCGAVQDFLINNLSIPNPFLLFEVRRYRIGTKDICAIVVSPSDAPVYVQNRLFYVRTGSQTRDLQGPDLVSYVTGRWTGK